jgi:phosphohistidine phosphatase
MKTLYLIRHAKSSWDNPLQADFDRPLNNRGKKDAPRMGKRLKKREILPDRMLTSPANRALTTCTNIASEIHYPVHKIKTEKRLYHAHADEILNVLSELDDEVNTVALVGHNPGLTDFINTMFDPALANLPTCGIVAGTFQTDSWSSIDKSNAHLLFMDYPKSKED